MADFVLIMHRRQSSKPLQNRQSRLFQDFFPRNQLTGSRYARERTTCSHTPDHFEDFNAEGKNVARAIVKYYPFLQNSVGLTPSEKEELGCVLGAVVDMTEEKIVEGTKLLNDEFQIIYFLVTHWKGTSAKALNLIVDQIMAYYDRWDEVITPVLDEVLVLLSEGFTESSTKFINEKFRSLGITSFCIKVRTKRFVKEIWPRIPAHARLREARSSRVMEVPYMRFNKIIEDAGLADEFHKAVLIPSKSAGYLSHAVPCIGNTNSVFK